MFSLASLKKSTQWLLWKYEVKDGIKTKVPYSYKGFKTGTTINHASEWCDYDTAKIYKEKINADGIGFVLPENMFFIDIDNRDINDPMVKKIISLLNTYTEISPSGTGIHLYGYYDIKKIPKIDTENGVKLNKNYYSKNPYNKIEIYFSGLTNRFATFTENRVNNLDFSYGEDTIITFLNEFMCKNLFNTQKKIVSNKENQKCLPIDTPPEYIISEISRQKNGEKFMKLFNGDISDYNNDDSSADLAFSTMVAFRTGDNPDLIFNVIKKSKLYREKWERDDYRNNTIRKAIDSLDGKFHNSLIETPSYILFKGRNNEPTVSPILLEKYMKEHFNILLVKNSTFEPINIYVYEHEVFVLQDEDMFKGLVKEIVQSYDITLYKSSIGDEVYKIFKAERNYIFSDELNNDESIINFRNCLVKITKTKKGKYKFVTMPHTPKIFTTIQLPCDWDDKPTKTKYFDMYINRLCENDPERIEILLEFIGVALSNVKGYRCKACLFLISEGNSGKSIFKSLIEHLLGLENCAVMSFKQFEERFGTASIVNKRFISNGDASYASVKELNIFKQLTGGDFIRYEVKGKMASSIRFLGVICMLMNHFVKFGGDRGKQMYDRIIPMPCCKEIPKNERIKDLLELILKEKSGIIKKAMHALLNVLDNNYEFSESKVVNEYKNKYIHDNSQYVEFWESCMTRVTGDDTYDHSTTTKIFQIFKAWCSDRNYYVGSIMDFKDEIRDYFRIKGYENGEKWVVHKRNGSYFNGWKLTDSIKEQYSYEYRNTVFEQKNDNNSSDLCKTTPVLDKFGTDLEELPFKC